MLTTILMTLMMTLAPPTTEPAVANAKIIDLDGSAPIERQALPGYYRPHGGGLRVYRHVALPGMVGRAVEVLIEGPKDTGKSRSVLEAINATCSRYPMIRVLIARKTRDSLTESIMVTLEEKVFSGAQKAFFRVGKLQRRHRTNYVYPNGSTIVLTGLDEPSRLQSGEYDIAYIPEATEVGLTEHDWEMVGGLLRNGALPWSILIGDCNPSYPRHWLNQRCIRGQTHRVRSRHKDNPSLTPARRARLDAYTGVRRKRLRDGIWAVAEGMVYDGWDPDIHVLKRFKAPASWKRYWVFDFGHTHPFVWQEWLEDDDGRLYLYREIYRTQTIVEDHARHILEITEGDPPPDALICDHDAEDRATLERHLKRKTKAAWKPAGSRRIGVQSVQRRMQVAGDGKPRLFIVDGALVHDRDTNLTEPEEGPPRPASTIEEIDSYIWNSAKDEPVKKDDDGMDAMRYMVCHVDKVEKGGRSRATKDDDDDDDAGEWRDGREW